MLVTLLGPNLFSKQRELRKLVGDSRRVDIYAEDGLGVWFEQVGQADLFGEAATLVGHELVEGLVKADQQRLAEHWAAIGVENLSQSILLLIKDEKKLAASPLKDVIERGEQLRFPLPNGSKLQTWAQLEAERLGLTIDKPALVELIRRLGESQFAIQSELERLADGNKVVTKEIVSAIPALGLELDNFVLLNSWSDKKVAVLMEQLDTLRRQGVNDQMIIGSLAWKIESLLLQAYNGKAGGRRTKAELEMAMVGLYTLDLNIKQGAIDSGIGLELWLVETTQ